MEENRKEEPEDEINLLDYLIILAKHKALILKITLSVALLTAVIMLFFPNIYVAKTTVLLPVNPSANVPVWLRQFSDASLSSGSSFDDPALFIQLLNTGPVYDGIIDRFGLMKGSKDANDRRKVRDSLDGKVKAEFDLPKKGAGLLGEKTSPLVTISVKDKDPAKAADMANAFVQELQNLLKTIAVTEASQRRLFFEEQLKKVKEDLIISEEAMRDFQEKTGVLKVEAQAGAVIESIAKLRAQIVAHEVELSVMKTYSTSNNPDLQRVEETVKGLKAELAKLERKSGNNPDTLMPTGRMPAVGVDYARKLRDLKFNETLFEIMTKQYEMARIAEAKNPALIQVIDKAVPTRERAGPQRTKKVLVATVISFFFSVVLAFFMEFMEKQKSMSPENRQRIETLKRYMSFKRKKII